MSLAKQILLSLVVIAVAGAGWLAYESRGLLLGQSEPGASQRPGSGGPPNGGGATAGGPGGPASGAGPAAGGPRSGSAGGGFAGFAAPAVVTAAVETDATGDTVRAIGTLAAKQEVTIYPQVTGVITDVAFTPGTDVKAGDVLIRLDDSDQTVTVDKAQIALDNANDARGRAEKLTKTNNMTQADLNTAVAAQQQAEVDLRAAQLELAKRSLKAPFSGTVGLSDVSIGDLVTTSKALATVADTSVLTVTFDVPERVAGEVKLGQTVDATSEALPGKTVQGTVTAIDNRIDPEARTMRVQATLSNPSEILKPGMSIVAAIAFPGIPRSSVPSLAVQWDRQGSYVWKLDGDVVHRTPIQIVARRSGTVIVAGALKEGDRVIVEGVLRLREGIKVARADTDQPAAGPPPAGGDTKAGGPAAAAASAATKG